MVRVRDRMRRRQWAHSRNAAIQRSKKRTISRIHHSQKDNLVIGLLNTDGLSQATLHDVSMAVERKKMDMCFLLETKRRLDEVRHSIDVPGYSVFEVRRSDEAGDRAGGGIAVYLRTKDGILFKRYDPDIPERQYQYVAKERQWILVQSEERKTAVCGLYLGCNTAGNAAGKYAEWNDGIFTQVLAEIAALRRDGTRVVLVGDFNAHIGSELGVGIPGNRPDINYNGRCFLEFIMAADLVHVNGATTTPLDWATRMTSGLWTWQRCGVSTVLDYGLICKQHLDTTVSLEIDDKGDLGGGSDHNFLVMTIKDNFVKQHRRLKVEVEKEVWDIGDSTNWARFSDFVAERIPTVDKSSVPKFAYGAAGLLLDGLKEVIGTRVIKTSDGVVALPVSIVKELKKKKSLEARYKSAQSEWADGAPAPGTHPPQYVVRSKNLFDEQKTKVEMLLAEFKGGERQSIGAKGTPPRQGGSSGGSLETKAGSRLR
jgi:hypothetical protein